MKNEEIQVGDRVKKVTGDYSYAGIVVAIFHKLDPSKVRVVVENADGMLFIFNAAQLELDKPEWGWSRP